MNTKRMIDNFCSRLSDSSFLVYFWDGDRRTYGQGAPEFSLHLKNKSVVDNLFRNIRLRFPEAYVNGDIEIDGDLQRVLRLVFLADSTMLRASTFQRMLLSIIAVRQRNSIRGAQKNISAHYDLGNEFFSLWLDSELVYSCAYFHGERDTIEIAQQQKLQYICDKLHLCGGERLLDIGCGWGALAIYAAMNRQAQVVGITLSEQQQTEAMRRVRRLGLDSQIEIRVQDYRELTEWNSFDRVVSVGMFEHVGRDNIREWGRRIALFLKPNGIGLLQTIGRMIEESVNPWILRYIFPGMYLPSLGELSNCMGEHDLSVIDVENLRIHYAYTLDRWIGRFEDAAGVIRRLFDERFVRMWRMYLNACAAAFRYGDLSLWQLTFTKGRLNDLPLTREHLYRGEESSPHVRTAPSVVLAPVIQTGKTEQM